jgi:hypothetical protein
MVPEPNCIYLKGPECVYLGTGVDTWESISVDV